MKYSLTISIVLLSLILVTISSIAQTSSDPWTQPINLSNSSSTTNPVMVIDSDGRVHVIWQDEIEGYVYSYLDGTQWSEPILVEFPFTGNMPQLIADTNRNVHAFWIDEENILSTSRVSVDEFGNDVAWSSVRDLAESVIGVNIASGGTGNLYLSYIRAEETNAFPAGVYFLNSNDGGASWSDAVALYTSLYFRSLDTGNVQISTTSIGGNENVYVVWDNSLLHRVFLSKSGDGGQTWSNPIEVDGPDPSSVAVEPFNIRVHPNGENVLLIWQAGLQSGFDCTQYYQWSTDGGESWSDRSIMLEDFVGCPQANQFLRGPEGLTLLFTIIQEDAYLLAWDGSRWSTPQAQNTLNRFLNPQTYTDVNLRCRQFSIIGQENMYVVGCDAVGNGDIWITDRDLGDLQAWFPSPSSWQVPSSVTCLNDGQIFDPVLVSDSVGRSHAFWSQRNEQSTWSEIYISRFEDGTWTRPVPVLSSPIGGAEQPVVAINSQNILFIVWSSDQSGGIYYSYAPADQANSPTEWAIPQQLPAFQEYASSPDIIVDTDGTLIVTYAIPINEERGVYLTKSSDNGANWSEPIQVADGADSGWVRVDQPKLAWNTDGQQHIIWTQYSGTSASLPNSLFYARSTDGGETWSQPEIVVDQPVTWSDIIGVGEQIVQRVWMEASGETPALWHDLSQDGGISWENEVILSKFGEVPGPVSLDSDTLNRLHLGNLVENISGEKYLKYLIWDGESWVDGEGLEIQFIPDEGVNQFLDVDVSVQDNISVIFTNAYSNEVNAQCVEQLLITERSTESQADNPEQNPIPTPTITGNELSIPTPDEVVTTPIEVPPTPTEEPTSSTIPSQEEEELPIVTPASPPSIDLMTGLMITSGLIVLFVGGSLLTIRFIRGRKRA